MTAKKITSKKSTQAARHDHQEAAKTITAAKVAAIARAEAKEVVGKQVSGFTDFLREQNVISIGIGLVLGIQIKAVVDTIMASFVNPFTQLLLPGQEALSKKTFTMTWDGSSVQIGWGAVVYSLFTFVLVAAIIYAGYKLLKLDKLAKKKDAPPPEPKKEESKEKKAKK